MSGSRNDAWRAGRGADRIVLGVGLRAGHLWERKGRGRRREELLADAPQPARAGTSMWRRWPQKMLTSDSCDRTITARSSEAWSIASADLLRNRHGRPYRFAGACRCDAKPRAAGGSQLAIRQTYRHDACRARLIPKLGARTTRRLIFVGRMRHSVRASPALK